MVVIGGKHQCLLHGKSKIPEKTSRSSSAGKCEQLGAKLPLPKNKAENDDLASVVKSKYNLTKKNQRIAIDLNDVAKEGEFVMSNGQNTTYYNWEFGQPTFGVVSKDFVVMELSTGKWYDSQGTTYTYLVCQQL